MVQQVGAGRLRRCKGLKGSSGSVSRPTRMPGAATSRPAGQRADQPASARSPSVPHEAAGCTGRAQWPTRRSAPRTSPGHTQPPGNETHIPQPDHHRLAAHRQVTQAALERPCTRVEQVPQPVSALPDVLTLVGLVAMLLAIDPEMTAVALLVVVMVGVGRCQVAFDGLETV